MRSTPLTQAPVTSCTNHPLAEKQAWMLNPRPQGLRTRNTGGLQRAAPFKAYASGNFAYCNFKCPCGLASMRAPKRPAILAVRPTVELLYQLIERTEGLLIFMSTIPAKSPRAPHRRPVRHETQFADAQPIEALTRRRATGLRLPRIVRTVMEAMRAAWVGERAVKLATDPETGRRFA